MAPFVVAGYIPDEYDDPYLELVYLLNQAAGLEHSLMAAYLYAALSLKDRYADVRGNLGERSYLQHSTGGPAGLAALGEDSTVLEVCIEEMQHLGTVNRLLVAVGGSPSFVPQQFPLAADIYPFPISPMPLTRYVAATFLWMEAAACAVSLDEGCAGQHEPAAFLAELLEVLRVGARKYHGIDVASERISHVGSLYRKILETIRKVADDPPRFLPQDLPWSALETDVNELMLQGEVGHYHLFRGLYTGSSFGTGAEIWRDAADPAYPSLPLRRGTAYQARRDTIHDPSIRRVAWLANLHYWIVLSLLDTAYRYADAYDNIQRKYQYKAIDNMTLAFWPLGLDLARHGWGMPFDPMATQYTLGRDRETALDILQRLVYEARGLAQELASDHLLPADYNFDVFESTLDGLFLPTAP